jgi:hypothetical protein
MTDNGFRRSPSLFAKSLQELDLLAEQLPPVSDSTSLSLYFNSSKFLLEKVILFSNFRSLFRKLDEVVFSARTSNHIPLLFNFFYICDSLFGEFHFFFETRILQISFT